MPAGTATQLIVDAAAFVPFGAENMQSAGGDDFLFVLLAFGFDLFVDFELPFLRQILLRDRAPA